MTLLFYLKKLINIKLKVSIVLVTLVLIVSSCEENNDSQIDRTITRFLNSIKDKDYSAFDKIITYQGNRISEDNDFDLLHRLYNKSYHYKYDGKFSYVVLDTFNNMGQRVIKLPYFKGYDSITAITNIDMILYFGPTNLFSLDELSDFKLAKKWDITERGRLLGLDPTPKADSIKKATGRTLLEKPVN